MKDIQIIHQNPKKVLEDLSRGEVDAIEFAVDQVTDEFMIYGMRGGLIDKLSKGFPDPRREEEISTNLILIASMAGHFQEMYAISQSPYALHSPTLLAELGVNAKVLSEGEGISRRGTKEGAPFNGDTILKMVNRIDPHDFISWYNRDVGEAYLSLIDYKPTFHILDCTDLKVNLENENYEGSGIAKRKKKKNGKEIEEVVRGYKLGSLRSLLDDGGIITGMAFGSIEVHDLELCRELLKTTPMLRRGDTLIVDRGFIDGKTITYMKQKRNVDMIIPLRSDMIAYGDSLVTAYQNNNWEKHPNREGQEIQYIEHTGWMWEECKVQLNGCVVRYLKEGKDGSGGREDYEHIVFVSTNLNLTGKKMLATYDLRTEIEEDHKQWKEGMWDMTGFTSTNLRQILYHVICVILSYNLCQVYSNTENGEKHSKKTLRQHRRQQLRSHEVSMLVFSGDNYALFKAKHFVGYILRLPKEIQEGLLSFFPESFTVNSGFT